MEKEQQLGFFVKANIPNEEALDYEDIPNGFYFSVKKEWAESMLNLIRKVSSLREEELDGLTCMIYLSDVSLVREEYFDDEEGTILLDIFFGEIFETTSYLKVFPYGICFEGVCVHNPFTFKSDLIRTNRLKEILSYFE